MIPSKWSDFSFWSKLYQQKTDEIVLLLKIEKNAVQMAIVQPFLQTIKYSVFAVILFIIADRKINNINLKEILICSIICLITSFIIICSQTFVNNTINIYRPIWLLTFVYLYGICL